MLAGLVVAGGAVWLWAQGCSDHPTQPIPEEPKDYPVYFMNTCNGTLFTYHPLTRQLDTAATPYDDCEYITASPDGRLLYVTWETSTVILDTDSLGLVAELPWGAWSPVAVSPDNQLVAIPSKDNLYLLRTSDYSIVHRDSVPMAWSCVFSPDSRTFYGVTPMEAGYDNYLYQVTLTTGGNIVTRRDFGMGSTFGILVMPNGSLLLLCISANSAAYLYDPATDSLVTLGDEAWYGSYLTMTPDGRYLFPSTPYNPMGPGLTTLDVFDLSANEPAYSIDIKSHLDPLGEQLLVGVGRMAVTPDGRWLVAHGALSSAQIMLFDLEKKDIVDYRNLGWNHEFLNIAVQTQP